MSECAICNTKLGTYEFNRSDQGIVCDSCAKGIPAQETTITVNTWSGDIPVTPEKPKSQRAFTGIAMMVGAAIWFFGGLAAGILFYYPPILFILGIVQFFTAITSEK